MKKEPQQLTGATAAQGAYQAKYENYIDYYDRIDIVKKVLPSDVCMHWHEFCELEFVVEGEGIQITGDQVLPYRKGVVFLLFPTDFHEVIVDPDMQPKLYSVKFGETFISSELYQAIANDGFETRQTTLIGEEFEQMLQEFEALYQEFQIHAPLRRFILKNMLETIIVRLERKLLNRDDNDVPIQKYKPARETNSQQIIANCLNYVQKNYNRNITLAEMAEIAHMTPNYFSTFFHNNTNCKFRDYLKAIRLRFSVSLLSNSSVPISEIGSMVGYSSYEHFERLFRKEMGVSPGAFRKMLLQKRGQL